MFKSPTQNYKQFKKERTDTKTANMIQTIDNALAQNVYECRKGQILTTLLEGNIQYSKFLIAHNFDEVHDKVTAGVFLCFANYKLD